MIAVVNQTLRNSTMLELEVVPERSIGNEQWELVLGKTFVLIILVAHS